MLFSFVVLIKHYKSFTHRKHNHFFHDHDLNIFYVPILNTHIHIKVPFTSTSKSIYDQLNLNKKRTQSVMFILF